MGRELISTHAAYEQTMLTIDTILASLGAKFSIIGKSIDSNGRYVLFSDTLNRRAIER